MEWDQLKQRTFRSVIWTIIRVGWSSVATFIVFAVLTRMLDPYMFGIFALATVFQGLTRIVATCGLSDAIIREKELDEELADTAFWANFALGALAGLTVFLFAAPYAAAIGHPEVKPVLWWLAPMVPISSLAGIHMARKLKDFGHKVVTLRVIASTSVGGGAAIASAWMGMGVWSLVIQAGVNSVLTVVFAWQAFRWVPRFRFSWCKLRSVLGFSGSIMVTRIIWFLLVRVQDLFIGSALGATAVGNYRVAWRMVDLISQAITQPMGSVALVTFSHLQDDRRKFEAAYLRMTGLASLVTFPLIFGYGILSTDLIRLLFGSKWGESAAPAHVLVLMAVPFTLNYFTGPALLAKGASKASLVVAVLAVLLTAGLSFFAAPFGLVAVAAAYVFRVYLTMPCQQYVLHKYAGIHPIRSLGVVWPPLIASLLMAGALAVATPFLHLWLTSNAVFVTASITLGGLIYLAGLLLFGRSLLASLIKTVGPMVTPLRNLRSRLAVRRLHPTNRN